MTDRADELTRRWTAWPSFRAMLESVDDPAYVPTLQGPPGRSKDATQEREEMTELADLYDQAQAARGDARRAYRDRVTHLSRYPVTTPRVGGEPEGRPTSEPHARPGMPGDHPRLTSEAGSA